MNNSNKEDKEVEKPQKETKTMSSIMGDIVWILMHSLTHKHSFFISDLEWYLMTPMTLGQFKLFYAKNKPIGVVFWAYLSDDAQARLQAGQTKLPIPDWKSGDNLWIMDVVSPFAKPEAIIDDIKITSLKDKTFKYHITNARGEKETVVCN